MSRTAAAGSVRNTITREEFVELKGQVSNLIHGVETLTATFNASQKEREVSQRAELARLESETKARFEKNEEMALAKAGADTEGRRWFIGVVAGLGMVIIVLGGWWTNTVKESVANELRNDLVTIKEQNATSIKDRSDLNTQMFQTQQAIAAISKDLAAFESSTNSNAREIETQFRAMEQQGNAGSADQWRVMSILWNTLSNLGAKMPQQPAGPYFTPSFTQDHKN